MAITINSPIAGASRPQSLAGALAYVRAYGDLDDYTDQYIRWLHKLCSEIGLRFELAFAQWCDETAIGTSWYWKNKRNPAGIGALPDGTYVGITYHQPDQSAGGHLVHLWLYVKGTSLPAALRGYKQYDPRWDEAVRQNKAQSAPTLRGLASSWATNPAYAVQIADHANKAFPGLPEGATPVTDSTLVFGRVPIFTRVNDYIPDFAGQAAGYYGQRMLLGVVWHRMVGTLEGTRSHFRTPGTGLTDFGVGVAGPDRQELDGVIYQWNDPLGKRSGWANGRIIAPWGDGLAFLNEFVPQYGADIANRGQVSIEISGQYNTPLTAKSRAAIVAITAYYADQAQIPWNVFPIWPGHGYSFVRYHQEITGPAEKICPGGVVIAETATLMAAIQARLKQYQVGGQPLPIPAYAAPSVPSWMAADISRGVMRDHTLNGSPVYGLERIYTAIRDTPRRQSASKKAKEVGPPILKGEDFVGSHIIGSSYVLTPAGTRVTLADLSPAVTIKPRAA